MDLPSIIAALRAHAEEVRGHGTDGVGPAITFEQLAAELQGGHTDLTGAMREVRQYQERLELMVALQSTVRRDLLERIIDWVAAARRILAGSAANATPEGGFSPLGQALSEVA